MNKKTKKEKKRKLQDTYNYHHDRITVQIGSAEKKAAFVAKAKSLFQTAPQRAAYLISKDLGL